MVKANKQVVRRVRLLSPSPLDSESRASVAVTVVWMLAALGCLTAQLLALGLGAYDLVRGRPSPWAQVAPFVWLVALLMGLLFFTLTPVAYRVRQVQAPRSLTVACLLIACGPLVRMAWIFFDELSTRP